MDLAHSITEKNHLRQLTLKLGVPLKDFDTAITNNHGNITEAAYTVLQTWRAGQTDEKVAWGNLQIALQDADLNNLSNLLHI